MDILVRYAQGMLHGASDHFKEFLTQIYEMVAVFPYSCYYIHNLQKGINQNDSVWCLMLLINVDVVCVQSKSRKWPGDSQEKYHRKTDQQRTGDVLLQYFCIFLVVTLAAWPQNNSLFPHYFEFFKDAKARYFRPIFKT